MADSLLTFLHDLKFAARSLMRTKGLTVTVVLTLALGIGANAAIFSLVRGVLLRPLVNRDEDRLIYIRQSARGIGVENAAFSVPEIHDLRDRVKTLSAFGDFSTIGFTMVGLGEPREVRAGVVGGSYFEVMGLHPVLGRLLDARDDGPNAAGAAVLTYRFWTTGLKSDPSVLGKAYPARLALGHHRGRAGTVGSVSGGNRNHRQRRHQPASSVGDDGDRTRSSNDGAIRTARARRGSRVGARRAARSPRRDGQRRIPKRIRRKRTSGSRRCGLRDQITSRARTVLLVLLAASALVFVIACSNVANLILARTVRREGELAIRAALGASTGALRRTLLAESLLLCGAGATLGVLSARPMVAILARYASRFSVRALDLTVDSSMLWVGAVLAIIAAVLLAFVPRLPSADTSHGFGLSSGSVRITGSTNRRLRVFAVTQIAASFVLLAGASMLLKTLLALQAAQTGFDTRNVLALNVPVTTYGRTGDQIVASYKEAIRRIKELPGVDRVAVGTVVPWRDAGNFVPGSSSRRTATFALPAKKIRARGSAPSRLDFSRRSASPLSPDAISTMPIAEGASRSLS